MKNGTKGRILFLQEYLLNHTDDEHALGMEDLIRVCEENGYSANRHTIGNDIATLNEYGTEIISERCGNCNVYHVGARLFELAELRMLVDAVSSSRFIFFTIAIAVSIAFACDRESLLQDFLRRCCFRSSRIRSSSFRSIKSLPIACVSFWR